MLMKVTYFVYVIHNRPKREKSPGDSRNAMCAMYVGKGEKKACTYKITAARSKVFNYENIASTFSYIAGLIVWIVTISHLIL